MRLHNLRMRAFGPFAGEQHIDFEPLGAGGLFLLDGPTGAGKSTVLDAITFALYGPGEGGGWGRLHSHFAAPSVEPEVQLEFSLRGVRQRVTRSPEYPRPKKRGDGYVTERAHVHLERWERGRWVSRSSRKDEVGEMLADDLGLSREQFTQVVLLPQGEFMRFLRASDDERRTLLTKLFGTQLYDRITEELDRRRVVATRDLDAAERRLRLRIGAAAEAAGLDRSRQDELATVGARACDEQLDELDRELAVRAERSAVELDAARTELAALRGTADAAAAQAERLGRFAAATASYAKHQQTRAQYDEAWTLLAAADRAEPVRALIVAMDDAQAEVEQALAAVLDVAPDAEDAWREGRGIDDVRAGAAEAARLAAELSALVGREQAAVNAHAAVEAARRDVVTAIATVERLATRAAELPGELDAIEAALSESREAAVRLDALEQRRATLNRRLTAVRELEELERQRESARDDREGAFGRYELAVMRHVRLIEARLANMAAELADGLTDGQPCAVCGALDHPALAAAKPGSATADDVAAAAQARSAAEQARDRAAARLNQIDERRAALTAVAALGACDTATSLETEQDELLAAIVSARLTASKQAALSESKAALDVEGEALVTEQQVVAAEVATAQSRLAAAERDAAELAADIADASAGYPTVAQRQRALEVEAVHLSACAEALATLAAARAARDTAIQRASREASDAGFGEVAAARAAIRPRVEIGRLREVVTAWQREADRLRGALASDEFTGLDAGDDAEVAGRSACMARLQFEAADATVAELALVADRGRRAVERFAAARADVAAARREHDRLDDESAPVVHLAKLARGVAGARRVALTTYVLRHWFEQVVAAANVRLSGMSSGRYELLRVDEASSRAERAGLTVQVLDRHTGEQRSPRSLSGGETFYTSLALALGLADVVRAEAGGVDLDTLFIDEGFGSLDADTLDQVMAVIDELRDRGRTVGIVSHVSELKNRIAERIEVRRLPDGSSTLRVVA